MYVYKCLKYTWTFVYCANPSFCPADKIVRPYRVYDLECQTLGFKKIYYWGNKIREASLFYFRFYKTQKLKKTLCVLELLNHNNVKIISAPWEHSNVHTSLFTADTQWPTINFGKTLECKMKLFLLSCSRWQPDWGFYRFFSVKTQTPLLLCDPKHPMFDQNNSESFHILCIFSMEVLQKYNCDWKFCENMSSLT